MARSFASASSQSIEVASAPSINLGGGDFTVLAWIRFPATPNDASMIVGKRAGGFDGDEGWELKFDDAGNEIIRWDVQTDVTGRQRAEGTATNITDGNWHLIGGDRTDGTPAQIQIWYDGTVIGTKVAATTGTVNTTTPLVIAAAYNTPNTNFLDGEVGPVFVCARILSLAEHQALAAGFSARFLRPYPCFLMELISRASPEPDVGLGGLTGTLQNAPGIVFNPRMVLPQEPTIGQDIWYEFANATIVGQSALAATLTRGRQASATIAGQSALTATILPQVPVTAMVAGQSTLTVDISANVAPEATISGQSAITATVNIDAAVGAEIDAQSGIDAFLSADVPVSAVLPGQSALTAATTAAAPVDAQIDGQSALTVTGDRLRGLSTTIGGQSALTAAVTITAGVAAQIEAQSAVAAATTATVPVGSTLAGQAGVVAVLTANVPVITTLAGASGVTATVTRGRPAQSTIAGVSTIVADIGPLVPVETTIAGQSALAATLSATVPLQAGIDAEADIRARPTYPDIKNTITVGGVARWLATVGGRITR